MEQVAQTFREQRANAGLIILLICSGVIGVLAGYRSTWTLQALFRVLVLSNILMVGYIVLLRSAVAGVLIYLYSLVFLNYYWRIVMPGRWPDLDIPRLMFVFIWFIFLVENLVGKRRILPNSVIEVMMLVVVASFVLSIALEGTAKTRQLLNGYVIPYAMFVFCKNVFSDKRAVDKFVFWLAVPLAFYFPVTAILEHYGVTALLFPRYIGQAVIGDVEMSWGGRAMGAFLQPVPTGFAMVAAYVLALYSLGRIRRPIARVYAVLLSLVTPIGVFFTYTRAVYMGLVAALLVLMVFSRKRRVMSLVLLTGLALAVIGNWSNFTKGEREAGGVGEVSTVEARFVLAKASMYVFMDRPLLGLGFGNFTRKAGPYIGQVRSTLMGYKHASVAVHINQHNQFLSVLTELGLVGFIPFALLYIFIFRLLVKARRLPGDSYDSELLVSVWAVMACYVAQILFIEPRFFEFMNVLPYVMVGIVAGGYQRAMLGRRAASRTGNNIFRKEYIT